MILRLWNILLLLVFILPLYALTANEFDTRGNGSIRIAWLSRPELPGSVKASDICADLELMLKAYTPRTPLRVTCETITPTRSLMGWWYHPETAPPRQQLLEGNYDLLLLAEDDEIVRTYPEFFFEGVRAISQAASAHGIRTLLVSANKPDASFRDKRLQLTTELTYRVGDGCGVEVVPAASGWRETLASNHLSGEVPFKGRANAYLTAAAIFTQVTGKRPPRASLETLWTTKKTADALIRSAQEAIKIESKTRQYRGAFNGVIHIEKHTNRNLKIYTPNTYNNDPLSQNLQFIMDTAFQTWFWRTPMDWYRDGFDYSSVNFDLFFGTLQQLTLAADKTQFINFDLPNPQRVRPYTALLGTNTGAPQTADEILGSLETSLFACYDYAKEQGVALIPYQLAWARVARAHPQLIATAPGQRTNDWLTYMLANMLYSATTSRYQPVPDKPRPFYYNDLHPRDFHEQCALIGFKTLKELASLTPLVNTILVRSEGYHITAQQPAFISIRLLEKPTHNTRVFCALDQPEVAGLSRDTLTFTPQNYDIEQTLRISATTTNQPVFINFMASAQSDDPAIDGSNDMHPFLINHSEEEAASFQLTPLNTDTNPLVVALAPTQRPADTLQVSIEQNGIVTQELFFDPDDYHAKPVQLLPTGHAYQQRRANLRVTVFSRDLRYNQKSLPFSVPLPPVTQPLPEIKVTLPRATSPIEGPAFVSARAEVKSTLDIRATVLYLGRKKIGASNTQICEATVEKGSPQTRLTAGTYTVWALTTTDGLIIASDPLTFEVRESRQE